MLSEAEASTLNQRPKVKEPWDAIGNSSYIITPLRGVYRMLCYSVAVCWQSAVRYDISGIEQEIFLLVTQRINLLIYLSELVQFVIGSYARC